MGIQSDRVHVERVTSVPVIISVFKKSPAAVLIDAPTLTKLLEFLINDRELVRITDIQQCLYAGKDQSQRGGQLKHSQRPYFEGHVLQTSEDRRARGTAYFSRDNIKGHARLVVDARS